jgi:hypothetical protein
LINELNKRFYHDTHHPQQLPGSFYCLKFNKFLQSPATAPASRESRGMPEWATGPIGTRKQIPDDRIERVDAG